MRKLIVFILLSGLGVVGSFFLIQNKIVRSRASLEVSKEDLLFKEVNKVKKIINDESAYPVTLVLTKNNATSIEYEGSEILDFGEELNSFKSIQNVSNTSYKSALYSLGFLRNHLIKKGLEELDVKQMDQFVDAIIDMAESFTLYDVYINHDHPVAERLETLILYVSLKKASDYTISEKELNHIEHLITLLMDEDFFTYHMNHGLMQIRALLRAGIILENQTIINKAKEYLFDVLPIYVSNDGGILESAFGYQYYIFLQFDVFNKLLRDRGDYTLQDSVEKQKYYLNSLVTNTGFLQGTGDSYNCYVDKTLLESDLKYYNIFHFENNVAGISSKDKEFMMLFVSLDNQPNVHKLQEDLGLYIYYKSPFIINSGTYSYELGDEFRQQILGQSIQNGPKLIGETIVASEIKSVDVQNDNVVFVGEAKSKTNKVDRKIIFNDKGSIEVFDHSGSDIFSSFIIHPEVIIDPIDQYNLKLKSANEQLLVKSDNPIIIDSIYVSDSYKSRVKATKLSILGNNHISFYLPDSLSLDINTLSFKPKLGVSKREIVINELQHKYPIIMVAKKVFVSYIMLAGVFILMSVCFLFKKKIFTYAFVFFNLFLLCNLFSSGKLIIFIVYFINSLR